MQLHLYTLYIAIVTPTTQAANCIFTVNISKSNAFLSFDLSGAVGRATLDGFTYAASVCAPPPRGGGACSDSLAHQLDAFGSCFRLSDGGAQRTVTAVSEGVRPGAEVVLRGGDACGAILYRSIKLTILCGDRTPAEASITGACQYAMLLQTPAGCPLECARDAKGAVCGGKGRGACIKLGVEGSVGCECRTGFNGLACELQAQDDTNGFLSLHSGLFGAFLCAAAGIIYALRNCGVRDTNPPSSLALSGFVVVLFTLAILALCIYLLGFVPPLAPPPLYRVAVPANSALCSKSGDRITIMYVPSVFEVEWAAGITYWNQDTCRRVVSPEAFDKFQTLINVLEAQYIARITFLGGAEEAAWRASLAAAAPLLSRLEYRDVVTGALVSSTLLEPLVGMLRDPRKVCSDYLGAAYAAHPFVPPRELTWDILRPFFFLDPDVKASVAALAPCPSAVPLFSDDAPRALLFDVGASTWNDPTGFGIKWLYELNEAVGIQFSHIYSWEAVPHGADFWDGVPLDARSRIHFFNIPASPQRESEASPLALLQKVARPQDYVVFKLDIDMESVEMPILLDMLSPEISALVDDVYVSFFLYTSFLCTNSLCTNSRLLFFLQFEHHVNVPEMLVHWRSSIENMSHTLVETYEIFTRLRRAGIRAHSWP